MTKVQKAILQTLAYADVFDYPLKEKEIFRFLLSVKCPRTRASSFRDRHASSIREALRKLPQISQKKGFYFLKGREKIVLLRQKRRRWSREKLKIARRTTDWLKIVPTIKMVAVTGALAVENSDKEDDIDLLIVTSQNRLWLTRLLTVFLIELVAKRRRPKDKQVKNKICLNMFLDEVHLAIPQKERDLFSAHEVCQLKPLWDKDGIYQKFLKDNQWVEKFLPNALSQKNKKRKEFSSKKSITYYLSPITLLEVFVRKLQLFYMQPRRTTEVVEVGRIRFHPQDARKWVLKEYQKRLQKLGVVK